MGLFHFRRIEKADYGKEVNFDHFQILRVIGRGSFGKVCIVQKKDSKKMFAMKYVNKLLCIERDAVKNVCREVEILKRLEHPFLVNIWFSFQDEEDLFMVTDLFLGGDLRYHIKQKVRFSEDAVRLMICELALALDYLQTKLIIHRDIKPENIVLDEEGHFHITDFNIAIVLENSHLATSMSGTCPYMAPEIFDCAMELCVGYSYPVDWWSLGVVAYEMLKGVRPYDIHSNTNVEEVRILFHMRVDYPFSEEMTDLISKLLCISPGVRISSLKELKQVKCLKKYDMEAIYKRQYEPCFVPPKGHLNCDPTFELEEMIIETNPLHKKKKRLILSRQQSMREIENGLSPTEVNKVIPEFTVYNRLHEQERRERERKEQAWEKELELAMNLSDPLKGETETTTKEKTHKCNNERSKSHKRKSVQELEKITNNVKSNCNLLNSQLKKSENGKQYEGKSKLEADDGQNKLLNIDYIDRTPSPVDRINGT